MKRTYFVALVCALGVGGWAAASRHAHRASQPPPSCARPPYDPARLDATIAFFEHRARSDPRGAIGLNILAEAYLQRSRETGDVADARRAESAARRSITVRRRRNAAGFDNLALSLLIQHRFREALVAVRDALQVEPQDEQARSLRAELLLEVGDYGEADRAIAECRPNLRDPSWMALIARQAEINGRPEEALKWLGRATRLADANLDLTNETVAWFHMRQGDVLAELGATDDAYRAYKAALAVFPRSYKSLFGLARLAARRSHWREAIDDGNRAADIVPAPETLALVGDAYAAIGKPDEAARQYAVVEAIGRLSRTQGVVYDRQRALFCADHHRHLDEALRLARLELRERHDVYAYDTLAWVCFQQGLLTEAREAMAKALARHTRDIRLQEHASAIERAIAAEDRRRTALAARN